MSYFKRNYPRLSLPFAEDGVAGFRTAQLGALHAIASHFTLRKDPALVTLPTGAGKTAVLLASAFLLRANRVLLVTPSRAVRSQIADQAATMATLKLVGALPSTMKGPSVHEAVHRVKSAAEWKKLQRYEVVVGTPYSLSPAAYGVAPPPADLFDLVLMDEAHHSPATTWTSLLEVFTSAMKVLCTATPFRLDEKELHGVTVYEYNLQRALDDGIVCPLEYVPVWPQKNEPADIALARKAEQVLQRERRKRRPASPPICLLARTNSRHNAELISDIYRQHTSLKLRTIHSGHSRRHIDTSIAWLKAGKLDGLLCVDMLGEGFDFPPLKVAAIHHKHKTLPITLQFIGRFGRVTRGTARGAELEKAFLLAIPDELAGEIRRLYDEGAAWERLIPTLHASRLMRDRKLREQLDSFSEGRGAGLPEADDVSLWSLTPLAHVKVFQVLPNVQVDVTRIITPEEAGKRELAGLSIEYCAVSATLSTAVLVTREAATPRWSHADLFDRVEYDLFVIVWSQRDRLLFINASRRGSAQLYEEIATLYTGGEFRNLSLHKINRVLRGLEDIQCFNVGMRNRQVSQETESYRILAGRQAERAVAPSDGRLFHRGHIFSRAVADDEVVTLGYSSASKIWSSGYLQIPELVDWCLLLGNKISNPAPVRSGNNLDYLTVGEELETVPDDLISADWNDIVYRRPLELTWEEDGSACRADILDTDWVLLRDTANDRSVTLRLEAGSRSWRVVFSLDEPRLYHAAEQRSLPNVVATRERATLLSFLRQYPLNLYTASFSRCHGDELFPSPREHHNPLALDHLEPIDWGDTDITREFAWIDDREYELDALDPRSIHGHLLTNLLGGHDAVLIYDHGTGEIADFVGVSDIAGETQVTLFHVKASGDVRPGNRVADVYEVCGQVVKSLIWVKRPEELASRLERRCGSRSQFVKGQIGELRELLGDRTRAIRFRVGLVQPGISRATIEARMREILAAADDYVRRSVGQSIFVICSP